MPLFEHGFLGAEADQIRQQILQKYTELFTSLKDLNDICHEYLCTAKYHHGEGLHVSAVSYFMRGLMTFQSLIILSERGCIEDVRALCRTLLQVCFRLAAIATDPNVVNRIVASALDLDRKRLRLFKPHDKELTTYAVYAMSLQMDNLVNLDKIIKSGLPASFSDFQNRFLRIRSDMPSIFNPQG